MSSSSTSSSIIGDSADESTSQYSGKLSKNIRDNIAKYRSKRDELAADSADEPNETKEKELPKLTESQEKWLVHLRSVFSQLIAAFDCKEGTHELSEIPLVNGKPFTLVRGTDNVYEGPPITEENHGEINEAIESCTPKLTKKRKKTDFLLCPSYKYELDEGNHHSVRSETDASLKDNRDIWQNLFEFQSKGHVLFPANILITQDHEGEHQNTHYLFPANKIPMEEVAFLVAACPASLKADVVGCWQTTHEHQKMEYTECTVLNTSTAKTIFIPVLYS